MKSRTRFPLLILAVFTAMIAIYWTVYAISPPFHQRWFRGEDRTVEWITFAGFFLAALVTANVFRFRAGMDRWSRAYIAGMAFFFFVCAGEEISWGQRIFGFETPAEMKHENEQGEFNLHNMNFEHFHPVVVVSMFMKVFGIAAPLILLAWRRWEPAVWRRYIAPVSLVPCFLFADLVVPAQKLVRPWITDRFGPDVALIVKLDTMEMKEMFWGLCVMFAALSVFGAWARRSAECRVSGVAGEK